MNRLTVEREEVAARSIAEMREVLGDSAEKSAARAWERLSPTDRRGVLKILGLDQGAALDAAAANRVKRFVRFASRVQAAGF